MGRTQDIPRVARAVEGAKGRLLVCDCPGWSSVVNKLKPLRDLSSIYDAICRSSDGYCQSDYR